ncbi:MAG: DUF4317 domain-containing protein [Oscillospiraceae bacterium]|nr:DUF4317 domain-containing protein [Oscillospiraceae bacterium]
MNKKDLAELKKHFLPSDDLLVIRKVFTTFIDSEKTRRCSSVRSFAEIPEEEMSVLYQTLARVLKGTLGKGLIEYAFPNEMYEEDKPQNLLWELLQNGLDDEEQVEKFVSHISDNMVYTLPYALFVAQCTYTVFEKNKFGEKNKFDSREFHFLVAAVCPVESRVDGLIYDEEENSIIRKTHFDRVVADAPTDGFLFPTFTGRGPDVNHVMYYTKKPKDPNVSIVEEVLGCHYTLSAEEEKETFRAVLDKAVGEELNLQVIASVNEKIQDYAKTFKDEPEPPVISDIMVRDILLDSGVSQERAETAQQLYRETADGNYFIASNLTDPKTTLSAGGVTVSISGDATDKVTTRQIDGQRFLMISLDDPEVTVNGFQMKM